MVHLLPGSPAPQLPAALDRDASGAVGDSKPRLEQEERDVGGSPHGPPEPQPQPQPQPGLARPAHQGQQPGPPPSGYLLPLLKAGPNNQIMQLKHALVLARLLGRTGLLTGIFEHHSDAALQGGGEGELRMLPLDMLFDRPTMQQHLQVQTVPEAKAAGWDGSVDGVLVFSRASVNTLSGVAAYVPRMAAALDIAVPPGVPRVLWKKTLCSAAQLDELNGKVKGFKHLLLYPINYDHAAWGRYKECDEGPEQDGAGAGQQLEEVLESFRAVHAALHSSRQLRDFSQRFVEEELQGRPFIAAHVRPYPDPCLEAWADRAVAVNDHKAFKRCKNKGLLMDLGPRLREVLDANELEGRVFVLAHPRIRWRVDSLLAEVNITPSYLSPNSSAFLQLEQDLRLLIPAPAATATAAASGWGSASLRLLRLLTPAPAAAAAGAWGSTSLLLLAEQAVAASAQARAFVGSLLSSASWAVVHARMSRPGQQLEMQGAGGAGSGRQPTLYFFHD